MRWKRWNWLSQKKKMELVISEEKDGISYLRKRFIKGNLVIITSPSLFKVLAEDIINNCW
jgi:hypothetical protein